MSLAGLRLTAETWQDRVCCVVSAVEPAMGHEGVWGCDEAIVSDRTAGKVWYESGCGAAKMQGFVVTMRRR